MMGFKSKRELRAWLELNHSTSQGIWVRLFKTKSKTESVGFEDVLDQGLCFGWSESFRHKYDDESYLQKFTPRKSKGTTSKRNLDHARNLIDTGEMTSAGLQALGLK